LFIAVFIFAFRDWESTKNQPSLGRKSKIIISVLLTILIIVFIIMPLSIQVYKGFFLKNMFSRNNKPDLYIVPVERKIVDIENQTQDNVKVNYANLEIKLPCKKIIKRNDFEFHGKPQTIIAIDKVADNYKFVVISIPTNTVQKGKDEKITSFETYSKMLYMTPDQINFFSITKKMARSFYYFF